jgi:hypothetical protein
LVWNRTADKVRESGIVPTALVCDNVDDFERALRRGLDRGGRARRHVGQVRRAADYFVGSPTAFASADVEVALRAAAAMPNGFGVYIPGGECACPNPGA